jgi:RNA polymerase-binding transcription factor DksA
MTAKEKKQYQRQLLGLGNRLKAHLAILEEAALRKTGGEASGNLSNTPLHMADLGSDTFEQEVSLSLLESENQQLEEIGAALERIDQGTYGKCEECGGRISAERLQAIPYAWLCIECARGAEQSGLPGNL